MNPQGKKKKGKGKGKKKELLKNLAISIASLVIFFGIGEVITRIILGNPLITEPDSILFWKYKKDQKGHQKFYEPKSVIDKNGFRYSGKEYDPDLPSIYVGGDSFAWGEEVEDTETFAGQLQKILDSQHLSYNVLNGGVPGYGIEQIIDRMEMECNKYHPEYSILLWVEEDIDRLRNLTTQDKKKFLKAYKLRSIFRYSAFMKFLKEQIFDKLLHKDIGIGFHGDRNIEYAKTHTFDEKITELTPLIKRNISYLRSRNITPIWAFVTIPSNDFKNYLSSLSAELSIDLVNPVPEYMKNFKELENMLTKHSNHYKPEVYEVLANKVFFNVIYNGDS